MSGLELEARVTKRALARLARFKPSEVPRARRSHMVLLLPQVEDVSDMVSWGKDPGKQTPREADTSHWRS